MTIDPDIVLNDLKNGAHTRTKRSLDKLHSVLKKQFKSNNKDFCIATIGRLSSEAGGPSTVSIRNKSGLHYRRLIETWAVYAGTNMKKPLSTSNRQREIPTDFKLLERIDDPALRVVFGQVIAERNRYRNELNVLKQHANVIIDQRPINSQPYSPNEDSLSGSSLASMLNEMEIIALREAVSNEFFNERQWSTSSTGQVKCEKQGEIYKHGYVNAIKKILASADES